MVPSGTCCICFRNQSGHVCIADPPKLPEFCCLSSTSSIVVDTPELDHQHRKQNVFSFIPSQGDHLNNSNFNNLYRLLNKYGHPKYLNNQKHNYCFPTNEWALWAREIQPEADCMLDYSLLLRHSYGPGDLAQPIVLTQGPSAQPGLELPPQNGLVLKL